jgi:hypothetical protein
MKHLILFLSVFITAIASAETNDFGYLLKTGDMAQDLSLKLTTLKTVKLSEMRGKIVIL